MKREEIASGRKDGEKGTAAACCRLAGSQLVSMLDDLQKSGHGGKITLSAGDTVCPETIIISAPCIRLEGEVWAYSADPNGVFEARAGSKLRQERPGTPVIEIGDGHPAEGFQLYNFGVQGNLRGMDTRPRFSFTSPHDNAGIVFARSRTDQGECRKLSFCGLGVGVCAEKEAEIDACRLTDCNFDGCAAGVYFAPRASYYARVATCVFADNPYCGLFSDGKGRSVSNFEIVDNLFVRCGGAFSDDERNGYPKDVPFAAVCLRGVSDSLFRNNLIEYPGVFWYYDPDAKSNEERQITRRETIGLYLEGDENRITGNTFRRSMCASAVIRGNRNLLLCNTADGDIVLEGKGNVVRDIVFVRPEARLVLKNPDALDKEQSNVPAGRITVAGQIPDERTKS